MPDFPPLRTPMPRVYERGVQQEHCSADRQLRRGLRLKEHLSVCY